MKKVIVIAVVCAAIAGIVYAATPPTCTGPSAGMVVGTQAQADVASASQGAGDLYVADELKVSGTTTLVGPVTVGGVITLPVVDITVTSPTVAGQMCTTSTYLQYISTAAGKVGNWIRVGSQ